jgi:class 3 adenylate cyclase
MSNPGSPAPDLPSAQNLAQGHSVVQRQLVPPFVLSRAALGETTGSFPAVVLFADISGFTPLTTRLMEHGPEGAEVLAQVLIAVFEPLVELVHVHGGFVAGYAGDALKAIFPADGIPNAPAFAVHTGMAMARHMAAHPVQMTRFGEFAFSVKVSIAQGPVTWRIWRAPVPVQGGQRAAFVLGGTALSAALALDPYATAGAVVTTCELLDHLPRGRFAVDRFPDYARVVAEDLSGSHDHPKRLERPDSSQLAAGSSPPNLPSHAAEFFPASLLRRAIQGEFRQVTTVFLNLQAVPADGPADEDAREGPLFSDTLFGLLRRYEGHLCRVGQIGAKDSDMTLMLLWGAPSSHENDAARALGFLLDLQAALAVPLRAGVTTGLVYAGFVGAPRQEEYTCYGAQVNLAARQLVTAQWDEILVDDVTARRGGTEFELTDAGARSFKGFAAPRRVFQVRQRRPAAQQPFYQGACVGRHVELAQLTSAVEPILAGRFGGVITLVGEVGMGKSRLAYELMAQLEKPGAFEKLGVVDTPPQWLLCQTDEVMRRPLNPFRYWLSRYFDQSPAQGEAVNQRAFAHRLAELFANLAQTPVAPAHAPHAGEARAGQLVAELDRTRSFLGALVDLRWADSLYERLEPQLRLANTLDALKALVKAESLRRPLILHVEDVHWLDPESQIFLQQLARNVDEYPFAMLLSARPAESVADAGELAATTILPATFPAGVPQTVVRLAAFTRAELEALAGSLLGGPAASSLVELVERRAEGNPFFAEQILLYLRENGHLASTPDEWRLREDVATTLPMGAAVLPADVRTVLTARLDRLADPVREIVQMAAVLGREFDPLVLAQMQTSPSDGSPGDLPGLLDAAQKAGVWAAIDRGRYLFRHALLRDAAYDMQLRARLRTLHRRAGAAVEQIGMVHQDG